MDTTRKLLIIGFDSMDFGIIQELGILRSFQVREMTAPVPLTGPAWTTLYTGESADRHGIRSVHGIYPDKTSRSFGTCKDVKFLWEYMNEAGLIVELFGLPVTYPPRKVNRYMVSGGVIPDKLFTQPEDLTLKDYYTDIWDYMERSEGFKTTEARKRSQHVRDVQGKHRSTPGAGLGSIYRAINRGIVDNFVMLHLDATDLCFVQFSFLDRVGHWSAFNLEQRKYWYRMATHIIGDLSVGFPEYDVMIVSDHGRPINDDFSKHAQEGVLAYKGEMALRAGRCNQYDFLPTILDYYGMQNKNLRGGSLWV